MFSAGPSRGACKNHDTAFEVTIVRFPTWSDAKVGSLLVGGIPVLRQSPTVMPRPLLSIPVPSGLVSFRRSIMPLPSQAGPSGLFLLRERCVGAPSMPHLATAAGE